MDAHALAIFVQGYAFGLLLNDVAAEKIVSEDWVAVIEMIMGNALLVD